jgi:hypothetical protein
MGVLKRAARRMIRHTATRPARRLAARASVKCTVCGKRYANPLTHTCTVTTDFRKRRRAAQRKARAKARAEKRRQRRQDAAQRRREAAARRRKAAAGTRTAAVKRKPRAPAHDPRTCSDPDCTRYGCRTWKDGYETGIENCPRDHA